MSDGDTSLSVLPAIQAPTDPGPDETRRRWFELFLVLLLAFGGSILKSLYILKSNQGEFPYRHSFGWAAALLDEASCLLLLAYVLSRRRMRIRDLGLRWSFRDLAVGLGVAILALVAYYFGFTIVRAVQHAFLSTAPVVHTPLQVFGHPPLLAIPLLILNPFFEELIVRAYLMSEIRALTNSWSLAAALSVVVQASYHLYYGWTGALSLAFEFLVFSLYYARTQKVTPIVFAHGLFDILGFVRLM
jgi:membrane protease YdiL (CAAX protease family)